MTSLRSSTALALLMSGFILVGCTKSQLTETKLQKAPPNFAEPIVRTVKTGAAVSLDGTQRFAVTAGQNGTVDIEVLEGYEEGTLILEATGSEQLDVFGANRTLSLDMTSVQTHAWPLQFNASSDGVHYIGIQARTEGVEGPNLSRAFAVRVEVGDLAAAAAKPRQDVEIQATPEGESVVVMQAEETIE